MIDENAHIFTRYKKIIRFDLSLECKRMAADTKDGINLIRWLTKDKIKDERNLCEW